MRRRRHEEEEEGVGELSLVPYLDMMVTLVMFLLFSFQAMLEMNTIPVNVPAYGVAPKKQDQQEPEAPSIMVTLVISDTGYKVQSDHPEITGWLDIGTKPDGEYDTERLHNSMVEWKKQHSLKNGVVITALNTVEYHSVVAAMDALREDGDKPLFPDVAFGVPYSGSAQ